MLVNGPILKIKMLLTTWWGKEIMRTQPNVIIYDNEQYEAALSLTRGCYQRGILNGTYRLSGADLKGKARYYSAGYRRSRENLVSRLRAHGIMVSESIGDHGKRILVIG